VSGALSVGSIALVYMFQISIKPAAMTVENGRQFTRAYQGVLGRRHTQRPIQALQESNPTFSLCLETHQQQKNFVSGFASYTGKSAEALIRPDAEGLNKIKKIV